MPFLVSRSIIVTLVERVWRCLADLTQLIVIYVKEALLLQREGFRSKTMNFRPVGAEE